MPEGNTSGQEARDAPGDPDAVLPARVNVPDKTHKVDDRIVSISQPWIRPIVRGKQTADVEFGAKVEMSVVDGFLRIEDMRWDAYNESTTFQDSVESYRKAYGHYPERVFADTIFRTRENMNMRYCKEHGIHLNGP